MNNRLLEIKGKDGGGLQFELNETGNVKNIFYYKNSDIFFMFKSKDGSAINLSVFRSDLKTWFDDKFNNCMNETLNPQVDSWFIKQFKKVFPFCFSKEPCFLKPSQVTDNCCFGFHLTDYAFLTCKRIDISSDYVCEFLLYDPYYVPTDDGNDDDDDNFYIDDGDETMVLEGSLLVSEEALLNFYQELVLL